MQHSCGVCDRLFVCTSGLDYDWLCVKCRHCYCDFAIDLLTTSISCDQGHHNVPHRSMIAICSDDCMDKLAYFIVGSDSIYKCLDPSGVFEKYETWWISKRLKPILLYLREQLMMLLPKDLMSIIITYLDDPSLYYEYRELALTNATDMTRVLRQST